MINRFILNEVSYFGPGAREVLPQEISRMGYKKAFVATDKDLIKFGVADKVLKVLENAGIPYGLDAENIMIGWKYPGAGTHEAMVADVVSYILSNGSALKPLMYTPTLVKLRL